MTGQSSERLAGPPSRTDARAGLLRQASLFRADLLKRGPQNLNRTL
jgi:hypothetical protein